MIFFLILRAVSDCCARDASDPNNRIENKSA